MNVTWLTQAGLAFNDGKTLVMADPYLSNSMVEVDPAKDRRMPVDPKALELSPDILLITHEHIDHFDAETLNRILNTDKKITVIAGVNARAKLMALGFTQHNYVMARPGTVWSERGLTFYTVRAEHSDLTSVGFIMDDGKRTYYISGDTLYNFDVIDDVIDLCEDGVDFAFIPINGAGNNMNMRDAADFAAEIGAKCAIPVHYGLIDDIDPHGFEYDERLILEPFKETKLI